MTLTLLTILVIALVIQGFCFRPAVAFAGGPKGKAGKTLQRFANALIISATYKITWLLGSPLAWWIWRSAFFSGSAAILLMVLAAVVFFIWPGLSLKLASTLFPRRLGRYSWNFALEMGIVMALLHIVSSCVWYLFLILI